MDITSVTLDLNVDLFICPLSHEIFSDPVIAEDGHLYERSAIDEWLMANKTSPITREPIGSRLAESYTIKNIIELMLTQNPKMRDQQFKVNNLYHANKSKIHSFIKTKKFEKLLHYTRYNLETLINENLLISILNMADSKVIKYLIDNSIDLDCDKLDGKKPVHYVCLSNKTDIMKYMFDKGVNLEAKDESEWRPIHHLCYVSNEEMVKYLVDKNVSLDCKTKNGWLPIHAICNYSSVEMIKLFVKLGVGINAKVTSYNGSASNYGCADLIRLNSKLKDSDKIDMLKLFQSSVMVGGRLDVTPDPIISALLSSMRRVYNNQPGSYSTK